REAAIADPHQMSIGTSPLDVYPRSLTNPPRAWRAPWERALPQGDFRLERQPPHFETPEHAPAAVDQHAALEQARGGVNCLGAGFPVHPGRPALRARRRSEGDALRQQSGNGLRGSGDLHAWGDSNLFLRRRQQQLVLTAEHRTAPAPPPYAL